MVTTVFYSSCENQDRVVGERLGGFPDWFCHNTLRAFSGVCPCWHAALSFTRVVVRMRKMGEVDYRRFSQIVGRVVTESSVRHDELSFVPPRLRVAFVALL